MTFSEKLITLRAGRGWSQEKLSRYLGVTRQAVGRWERSECLPDAVGLTNLARIFDVDPEWLLDDDAGGEPKPKAARRTRLEWFDWLMLGLMAASIASYPFLSSWIRNVSAAEYAVPRWQSAAMMALGALRFISAGWSVASAASALCVSIRPRGRVLCTVLTAACWVFTVVYVAGGITLLFLMPDGLRKFIAAVILPGIRHPFLLALTGFLAGAAARRREAA